MSLSKLGKLIDKMLDQPDSWKLRKIQSSKSPVLVYKEGKIKTKKRSYWGGNYTSVSRTKIIELNISSKYDFDIRWSRCLSDEDKNTLWPKARALGEVLNGEALSEFNESASNHVKEERRNTVFKEIMKGVLGITDGTN